MPEKYYNSRATAYERDQENAAASIIFRGYKSVLDLKSGAFFNWTPNPLYEDPKSFKGEFEPQHIVVLKNEDSSSGYCAVELSEMPDPSPHPAVDKELRFFMGEMRAARRSLTLRQAERLQALCEKRGIDLPLIENYTPRHGLKWSIQKHFGVAL